MRTKYKMSIILWTVLLAFSLFAKRPPERPQWLIEKLKQFKLMEEDISYFGNKSYYSEGILRSWENVRERVSMGSPEEMAREFLRRHAKELGMKSDLSDIALKEVKEFMKDIYRVEFYQTFEKMEVYGGEIHVILKRDGEVLSVYSGYKKLKDLTDLTVNISEETAVQIVKDFLQIQGKISYGPKVKLAIFPYKGKRVVYIVYIITNSPMGAWEAFVDAKTGEIIHLFDTAMYYDGRGYVFNPDPITSAHTNYGGCYVDNYDNTNDCLNTQRKNVILRNIHYSNNLYYLKGPYVKIRDLDGYPDPPYSSGDGNFYYDRSQQDFEAVMAYYHIDNFQRYLQSIGFWIHLDTIDVDPHYTSEDQSYYLPGIDAIGLGEGGVDDAEDADVIIHEYGHAIAHSAMGGFNYSLPESGALSEGYSDYMAGSYSARIDLYQSDLVFNWDGHNEFWPGRVLNSTKHYPEDMTWTSPHADGEIWSACLWKIFDEYGSWVADRLAIFSLDCLWSTANFKDAAKQVLFADYFLFNGAHASFIRNVFYERGILRLPLVRVSFPNGGEKLVQGSTERIKWIIQDFDALTDHINIYYYHNNSWHPIVTNLPAFYNFYDWSVPNIESDHIKIKVQLADLVNNEIAYDVSDNYFKIVPRPPTYITYPNGGEILLTGTTVTITWNNSDPYNVISYVKLYYSTNGGQTYTQIDGNLPNTGNYTWQVPNTPTNQCKIKIEAYNIRNVLIQQDISDGNFIITAPPSVTLLWPNASGIFVEEGKTCYIRYNGKAVSGIKK